MSRLRGLLWLSLALATLAGATSLACSKDPVAAAGGDDDDDDGNVDAGPIKSGAFERDGSTFDSAPPPTTSLGFLHATRPLLYSGFDGVHEYKVPVGFQGGGADLTAVLDDPTFGTIAPVKSTAAGDVTSWFMVTTKKAGLGVVTAKSGTETATVRISAGTYDGPQWDTGAGRYKTAGTNGDPACTNCHVSGKALDHSPTALAGVTDSEVGKIMTEGVKPGPKVITEVDHTWELGDDERRGLIAYLRSLEPRGFAK